MRYFFLQLEEWLQGWLGQGPSASLITNIVLVVSTILVFWLIYYLVFSLFRKLSLRVLKGDGPAKPFRIQNQDILSAPEVARIYHWAFKSISWILRLIIILSFINTALALFNWSRAASDVMSDLLVNAVGGVWGKFTAYLPDLITMLVIIAISWLLTRLFKLVFDGIDSKRIKLKGFHPEWAVTSYSLLRLMIIAMTLVVIFPYLPGSDSPAFRGVSLFFGLLFSLGSTTAVANVVAGIVITYTRAFGLGDFVQITDVEGKVVERTAFVTRLRTHKNVEISIPNQAVLSGKVINYSIQGKRMGVKLHTSVTIGYDVPWPQVQELLVSAARGTEHIEQDPPPFVLQTSLDDSYVSYELNATTKNIALRPSIYSTLHANILDAFHSAGVEITSPIYKAMRDGNAPAIAPVTPKFT